MTILSAETSNLGVISDHVSMIYQKNLTEVGFSDLCILSVNSPP